MEVNKCPRKFVQNINFNLHKRNSIFPNLKDYVPQKYKSDLIHKCACPQIDCDELYICETQRHFEERIIVHNKRDKKITYLQTLL